VASFRRFNNRLEEDPSVKKLLTLVVAAAFLGATAGLAAAQAPKEEKKAAEKSTDKKMAAKNASGTVKSAGADSVVVAGKDKGKETEWTFAVDPKTKIKKGGKDVTAADLKSGDSVAVRYMEHDGKAVAQTINVRGAGTAKKSETKAGEAKPAEKK
jgi:hypothetical protein